MICEGTIPFGSTFGLNLETMTDDERERIAIEVEHLPPDEAQAEYDKRINT